MLYRENEILSFDEPTAVLTPQEIDELMEIMRNLAAEGKSILFISHKLNEIMAVSDRCTVLRKGKYIGTVETKDTSVEQLSAMMVGHDVNFHVVKGPANPGDVVLDVAFLLLMASMLKISIDYLMRVARYGTVSVGLKIPMWIVYSILPLFTTLTMVRLMEKYVRKLINRKKGEGEK